MRSFILLLNPDNNTSSTVIDALDELFAWNHGSDSILYYFLDYAKYPTVANKIGELWPYRMNLFCPAMDGKDDGSVNTAFAAATLCHMAIKNDADVYSMGEPTGVDQVFENMLIEITSLPLS